MPVGFGGIAGTVTEFAKVLFVERAFGLRVLPF